MEKAIYITYFIHSTTTDNEKGLASGWADPGLSDLGKRQCTELKEMIKDKKFDVVFCSDLRRSFDSAKLTFGDSVEITKDPRLREINYGDLTRTDSKKIDSLIVEHVNKQFPNGESYMDVEKRVKSFLNDLKKNYIVKSVAIVSHRAPQLALDVIIKGKTWEQAIKEDWRSKQPREWRPGWDYKLEIEEYHGIIVDKSLKSKKLKKFNVIGSKESKSENWTMLKISFPEEKLDEMIEFVRKNISEKYYAHFYKNDELIVIFKDKNFHITPDRLTWASVIGHGLSLGIPKKQLIFKPCKFEDETY